VILVAGIQKGRYRSAHGLRQERHPCPTGVVMCAFGPLGVEGRGQRRQPALFDGEAQLKNLFSPGVRGTRGTQSRAMPRQAVAVGATLG
jgi:hypothetical protein